jgi:murein DD-endopeptidase MepM/ murein hydrolase activator NlpD
MSKTLYRYNAETCQYERVQVKTSDVLFYACGVLMTALLMLAGILALHDYMFDSAKESALRKENNALKKNGIILTSQIHTIEAALSSLAEEDDQLHAKFFGASTQASNVPTDESPVKNILLGGPDSFRNTVDKIGSRTAALLDKSAISNAVTERNSALLKYLSVGSLPSLQPISAWDTEKVFSGFGMRVNPFHKGLYEHPGIDISVPRGTPVISTAAGVVKEIKRSTLEAGYGNYIEIDHGNGFSTRYAHLEEIRVRQGQKVTKSAVIATTGSSGGSIAPHLHYEIIRHGKQVDPVHYMIGGLSSTEYDRLKAISQKQNQSLD